MKQDGCEFGILNLVNSIGLYETGKKHTRLLCEGSPMFASLYIGRHDFGNGLAAVVLPKVCRRGVIESDLLNGSPRLAPGFCFSPLRIEPIFVNKLNANLGF